MRVRSLVSRHRRTVAAAWAVLFAPMLLAPGVATPNAPATERCPAPSSLVVLGDSGSTGYGLADDRGTGFHAETEDGWASRLSRHASTRWDAPTSMIAHDGAMVSDFLPGGRWQPTASAVARIGELRPSTVLIELGGNEFIQGKPPALFAEQYRRLLDGIRATSPGTTILPVILWEPGARAPDAMAAPPWAAYRDRIIDLSLRYDAEPLDLGASIPPAGRPGSEGLYLPDRVHLSPAGHRVFAEAVLATLGTACSPARG